MRLKKFKSSPAYPFAVAACVAVLFWFILINLGNIFGFLGAIINVCFPVIAGAIIAYILDPVVEFFNKSLFKNVKSTKVSRVLSVVLTLIIVIGAFAILIITLIPQVTSSAMGILSKIDVYEETLINWIAGFGVDTVSIREGLDSIVVKINDYVPEAINWILESYKNIGNTFLNVIIGCILAVYFMLGKYSVFNAIREFFIFLLRKYYGVFAHYCGRCNIILKKYVTGSIIEAICVGTVNAILMVIFQMPYIAVVSIVVGVTNLAPTFGPIVGGIIGFVLLFLEDPMYGFIFLIFTVAIQFCDGYIVKPKLFGETLEASSIWILICIVVLGKLFGVPGLLIAIPFAAIVQILLRDFMNNRNEKRLKEITNSEKE